MPTYLWEGQARNGELKKGEMEAVNETAVRVQLRRQGVRPTRVKEKPKDLLEMIPVLKKKIKTKSVVVFARQFSTMIGAGLPLIQCLEVLGSQEKNKAFAKIIKSVKDDIEGGSTLTDALRKHPKVFDELFVNMIQAGEAGGILDTILIRLAAYMEKIMKLKSKVKSAMTYPAAVLIVSVLVVIMLLLKVVPVFSKMFSGMGRELPALTQTLIDFSDFLQNNIIYLFGVMILIVVAFIRYYRTEMGKATVDRLLLKMPVFGPLLKKVAVSKFARTLSTMMSSGVPILDGLEIVSKTAGNKVVEAALMETRKSISEGKTIAEPLAATNVFPPMVVQMIAVGEATGALDAMLAKIADFYDDEVEAAVAAMTSLLEPALMVFLGGLVGSIIVAMYLPIFQLGSLVG